MKISLKRYKVYEVVTILLLFVSLALVWVSPWFVLVTVVIALQHEFVHLQVSVILKQYVLLRKKEIAEPHYTKSQAWLKRVFAL